MIFFLIFDKLNIAAHSHVLRRFFETKTNELKDVGNIESYLLKSEQCRVEKTRSTFRVPLAFTDLGKRHSTKIRISKNPGREGKERKGEGSNEERTRSKGFGDIGVSLFISAVFHP